MRKVFKNPMISIYMFPDIDIVRTTQGANISAITPVDDGRMQLTVLEERALSWKKVQQAAEIMQMVQ